MADSSAPALRFLSLFVPDLADAVARYAAMLGVAPTAHPYAARGPVVFDLGGTKLALYQCDLRATHPGDVGIGLFVDGDGEPDALARRALEQGGRVLYGPSALAGDGRRCVVLVLPDRHFFEVVGRRAP